MTLPEFLLARIAEDEAAARDLVEALWPGEDRYIIGGLGVYPPAAIIPAKMLAECDAKRRIVALHTDNEFAELDYPRLESWGILQLLALPYADHPDFKPEWRV